MDYDWSWVETTVSPNHSAHNSGRQEGNMVNEQYLHSELTGKIIGCAMEVHKTLGNGFAGAGSPDLSLCLRPSVSFCLGRRPSASKSAGYRDGTARADCQPRTRNGYFPQRNQDRQPPRRFLCRRESHGRDQGSDPVGRCAPGLDTPRSLAVELQGQRATRPAAQAINYLEAYGLEVGLLLNFGSRSLQFKHVMKPAKNRPPKSG